MAQAPTETKPEPTPLRLFLLGSFRLEHTGRTIHFPTRKVESLFAFLALHPNAHSREKLATLFWGDFSDEPARHSLRAALAAIRKELGDEILVAGREMAQLNPDYLLWTDAREFERLTADDPQAAMALYCGDLLNNFYDDWIPPERERLCALYLDGLLRLTQDARAKSQYAHATEFAQKVLASDSANEKAHQHIIFCLAMMGDRIGALKQYDECEKKLRDELGVKPSKETLALRDRIKQESTGINSRAALFTNLPVPLTSFIGREHEMAETQRMIETTRWVTLVGAGGCGKTRLAIQAAANLADANRFEHGVWWVDLAPLHDAALVPQAIAVVFNLQESSGIPLPTVLVNYFRAKELLLVLDNCEHLLNACARLVDTWLSTYSKRQVLATSREPLDIPGEAAWRVPSLALPDVERLPAPDQIRQYDAIRFFTDRALAASPTWRLAEHCVPTARICARLDGIPLAIELAAARLRMLSVEQVAERLDDRFNLLTGGNRTALPRHQTLRAAMDWSYNLLSGAESVLLRRLGVCRRVDVGSGGSNLRRKG